MEKGEKICISYSRMLPLRNRDIKKRSPAKWTLQIRNAAHWSAPAPKKRFQSVTLHVYVSSDRPTGAVSHGRVRALSRENAGRFLTRERPVA